MRKLIISLLGCFACAAPSFAGHEMVSSKEMKEMAPVEECFKDRELQIDVFAAYATGSGHQTYGDHAFGGGIGINYFFMRNLGVGAELVLLDGQTEDQDVLQQWAGNFFFRFPIKGNICWIPYGFIGGGYESDGGNRRFGHVGAGLEFRVRHNMGLFLDARYVRSDKSDNYDENSALVRTGVRFPF